jgi:hypothetical protein
MASVKIWPKSTFRNRDGRKRQTAAPDRT